ncbi:MAG: alpha/beta hydrolase [Phototrophicaceae bacterium]
MNNNDTLSDIIIVNSTSIFYTRNNPTAEETILMIHAGICDHRMWDAQVHYFAQNYHVITFDIHGFGKSGVPTTPFAFHTDIIALLDGFGIEQTWIMAASLGSAIAFDVALMHPERVQGLILAAPAIGGYQYTGDVHPLKAAIDAADEAHNLALVSELEVQLWVDGKGRKPSDIDSAMRDLVVEMNLIALQTDESFWDLEIEIDPPALARLSDIEMPVSVIYGDLDIAPSLERVELIVEGIQGAQKVLIADTAHLPNMEKPRVFNQFVERFLQAER